MAKQTEVQQKEDFVTRSFDFSKEHNALLKQMARDENRTDIGIMREALMLYANRHNKTPDEHTEQIKAAFRDVAAELLQSTGAKPAVTQEKVFRGKVLSLKLNERDDRDLTECAEYMGCPDAMQFIEDLITAALSKSKAELEQFMLRDIFQELDDDEKPRHKGKAA